MSIANHYGIKSLLACIIIIAVAKFLNDYRLIDAKDETDRSEYILIRDAHEVLKKCKKVGKTHRREYGNDVFLEGAEKETFGVREMAEYRPPTSQISKKCIATLLEYPSKLINTSICQHRFVWITGLHYSGTSLLNYIVQSHPRASGHLGVTTNMDEGQWLQAEYPPATKFGGTCRFMFRQKSFMDENHELATNTTRACLYADWARYWDLRRPVLIEKSPPSILQLRFRERLFPDVAASVVVVRHPLYACVAKRKKGGALFHPSAVQHALDGWLAAHDYLRESLPHLARYAVLQFEDFFRQDDAAARAWGLVNRFFPDPEGDGKRRLEFHEDKMSHPLNPKVDPSLLFAWAGDWEEARREFPIPYRTILLMLRRYEERVNAFGYSLLNVTELDTGRFEHAFGSKFGP